MSRAISLLELVKEAKAKEEWLKGRSLFDVIKEKIKERYSGFPLSGWRLDYQLKWIGGKRFEVDAWMEKAGASDFEVKFIIKMSKRDVKRYLSEIEFRSGEECSEFERVYGEDVWV